MRTHDEPTILPPALCAAPCPKLWERWCRGCNLVFCADHADRTLHRCKPDEVRPDPSAAAVEPDAEASLAPPQNGSTVSIQMPVQIELFVTPPEPPPPPPQT